KILPPEYYFPLRRPLERTRIGISIQARLIAMLSKTQLLPCFLALCSGLPGRAAGPYGNDNGWAVDNSGHILLTSTIATQMVQGETGWIRIEMRLIPGHSTWDSAMLGYYDAAVNNARNAGIQVLLLIDGGSWPGSQTDWCAN